jgi:hypothetical protein
MDMRVKKSKTTDETVQPLISSISDSGLPDKVKTELVNEIKLNAGYIAKRITPNGFMAPEENNPWVFTELLISYFVAPILQKYHVSKQDGRNLSRDIYKSLGGAGEVKYETK